MLDFLSTFVRLLMPSLGVVLIASVVVLFLYGLFVLYRTKGDE